MSSVVEHGDYIEYEYSDIPAYTDGTEFVEHLIAPDDSSMSNVEYLEDDENVPLETMEGHTIFLHEGKQYLIPNELSQNGKTIVLQDEDGHSMEFIINPDENEVLSELDNQEHLIIDNDTVQANELTELLSGGSDKCYMVLENGEVDLDTANLESEQLAAFIKDGQLHFEATDLTSDQIIEENDEATKNMEQVMGKNLITGETITLSGLFNKMKKNQSPGSTKQESDYFDGKQSASIDSFDTSKILNKKIPVGTSIDGKKIYGRILEIRKKDEMDVMPLSDMSHGGDDDDAHDQLELRLNEGSAMLPTHSDEDTQEMEELILIREHDEAIEAAAIAEEQLANGGGADDGGGGGCEIGKIEELLIDNTGKILQITNSEPATSEILNGNVMGKNGMGGNGGASIGSGAYGLDIPARKLGKLDRNTSKTLSGLMELETVQKRLVDKDIVVKIINKKISDTGIKKSVTYLFGSMECDARSKFQMNAVDADWIFKLDPTKHPDAHVVNEEQYGHQNNDEEEEECAMRSPHRDTEFMTLSIVEESNGSQKTKVSIPNLGVGSTKCNFCMKNFKSEQHLKRHVVQHTRPKKVTCDICDKCFSDTSALMRHKKIHSVDKEYECPICHKQFNSHGSVKRHITVHNPGLRPLQCLTCYQRFTDESSLKKHILIHTGVKPFTCDVCDKNFVNQGDLNFHRRIHDPMKRFNCETCGKDFSRYSNLTRHREIHKGSQAAYTCNICGCAYNFISSLTRHLVTNHIKPGTG